jgi:hypothetical protein
MTGATPCWVSFGGMLGDTSPRNEAAVIRSFQELMPYGLDVPEHTDCMKYSRFSNRLWSGCPGRLCPSPPIQQPPPTVRSSSRLSGKL